MRKWILAALRRRRRRRRQGVDITPLGQQDQGCVTQGQQGRARVSGCVDGLPGSPAAPPRRAAGASPHALDKIADAAVAGAGGDLVQVVQQVLLGWVGGWVGGCGC